MDIQIRREGMEEGCRGGGGGGGRREGGRERGRKGGRTGGGGREKGWLISQTVLVTSLPET